jgi:hypothetical protein
MLEGNREMIISCERKYRCLSHDLSQNLNSITRKKVGESGRNLRSTSTTTESGVWIPSRVSQHYEALCVQYLKFHPAITKSLFLYKTVIENRSHSRRL